MNEQDAILFGLVLVLLLLALMLPATGTIAGITISLPVIGWLGFGAFAVLALLVYMRK